MHTARIALLIYIVLLELGGLIGFIKAGSKASLIASTLFSGILLLFFFNFLPFAWHWVVLIALLVVFGKKFVQSKKFMPSGLMLILTGAALAAAFLLR